MLYAFRMRQCVCFYDASKMWVHFGRQRMAGRQGTSQTVCRFEAMPPRTLDDVAPVWSEHARTKIIENIMP